VKAINERSKRKAGALPNVGQPGAIPQQNGRVGMGRQPVDDASPTADRYGDRVRVMGTPLLEHE